jgi:hypothetical protein
MSFYGFTPPKRWDFCPACQIELKVRLDGKFPHHSPGKGCLIALKGQRLERCQGSGKMAPCGQSVNYPLTVTSNGDRIVPTK